MKKKKEEEKEEEALTSSASVDNSLCEQSIHARTTYPKALCNLCCS